MVELLGVVLHGPFSLLEVHELLALLPHHTCRDVVGAEGIAELSSRHLVIHRASGGVVGPPRAGVTPQLLRGKEGVLHLDAAPEPELPESTGQSPEPSESTEHSSKSVTPNPYCSH
jgi:hypothetical protein